MCGEQRRPVRSEDSKIELGIEERDFETVAGHGVAMRLRDAMNEAFEAQPSKVVGHLSRGVGATEECFDRGAHVVVTKPTRQMGESAERLTQGHHARIAEAQRRDALAVFHGGALEPVERLLRQDAVVTDAFDFEEFPIDLVPEFAQV